MQDIIAPDGINNNENDIEEINEIESYWKDKFKFFRLQNQQVI